MGSDAYGCTDTAAPRGDSRALSTMWIGIGACILGAVSPCLCYLPWVIAFPMGCVGLYRSLRADRSTLSATGKAVADAAMVTNGLVVAFGLIFLGFLLFYLLYVGGMWLFMGAGGSP